MVSQDDSLLSKGTKHLGRYSIDGSPQLQTLIAGENNALLADFGSGFRRDFEHVAWRLRQLSAAAGVHLLSGIVRNSRGGGSQIATASR